MFYFKHGSIHDNRKTSDFFGRVIFESLRDDTGTIQLLEYVGRVRKFLQVIINAVCSIHLFTIDQKVFTG